jgi:hypothetical protein
VVEIPVAVLSELLIGVLTGLLAVVSVGRLAGILALAGVLVGFPSSNKRAMDLDSEVAACELDRPTLILAVGRGSVPRSLPRLEVGEVLCTWSDEDAEMAVKEVGRHREGELLEVLGPVVRELVP